MTAELGWLGGAFPLSWGHVLLIMVSKVSGPGEHFGEKKTTPFVFVRPHKHFLPHSLGPYPVMICHPLSPPRSGHKERK